ncbi:MAG: hypothetical protein ACRENP_22335 [Longimicrobiales bacterium]
MSWFGHAPGALGLRAGDLVEVRSEEDILATLDAGGTLDGLPFMPEMLAHCGQRYRVDKRADKTCDTINYHGSRRMHHTVHLGGLRCNGSAHGGCQALCLFFWKEAWLKRVTGPSDPLVKVSDGKRPPAMASTALRFDRTSLRSATRRRNTAGDDEVLYRCQATDLLLASTPMAWWDVRQYVRDVRSGNVGVWDLVNAAFFCTVRSLLLARWFRGYSALLWLYNRVQAWRGGSPYPIHRGNLDRTPTQTLDLRVGECVRVKSHDEILQTIDTRGRNRGLSFDKEMVPYCGTEHRVVARVERIIDERSGKMVKMSKDCIILEGAVCRSVYSEKRFFCPRSLYPFWREIWLQRVTESLPGSQPMAGADA